MHRLIAVSIVVVAVAPFVVACNKSDAPTETKAETKDKSEKAPKKEESKPKDCGADGWKSPDGAFCFVPPAGFKPQEIQKDQINQYGEKVETTIAFMKDGGGVFQLKWGTPSAKFDDMKRLSKDSADQMNKAGGKFSVEDVGADGYVQHAQFKGQTTTTDTFVFKTPKELVICVLTDDGNAQTPAADMRKACKSIQAL